MKKSLFLLLTVFSANVISQAVKEMTPEVQAKNKTEVKQSLNAASYNLFLRPGVNLFNFDINKPETKRLVAQWNEALGKLKYFIYKLADSKQFPDLFEKVNKLDTDLITKIAAFSSLGKQKLVERKKSDFDGIYTKLSNEIKDQIQSLSKDINAVRTFIKVGPKEAKELMLYLVNDIYRSVYEKLATDVNTYVKNIALSAEEIALKKKADELKVQSDVFKKSSKNK